MKQIVLCTLAVVLFANMAFSQAALRQKNYNLDHGLAIDGYDPVSYFKGKPQRGSKTYTYTYDGVTYRFVDAANLNAFKANPAGYEPQYGGWCAYAMGNTGEKVEIDPETYKIINGRLYLFYNKFFNNTLKTWNKNENSLKPKADANWQKINH
jgi:YHS domain-containing protein